MSFALCSSARLRSSRAAVYVALLFLPTRSTVLVVRAITANNDIVTCGHMNKYRITMCLSPDETTQKSYCTALPLAAVCHRSASRAARACAPLRDTWLQPRMSRLRSCSKLSPRRDSRGSFSVSLLHVLQAVSVARNDICTRKEGRERRGKQTGKKEQISNTNRPAPPQVQVAQRRLHLELRVCIFAKQGVVGPLDHGEYRLQSSAVNIERQIQQGGRMERGGCAVQASEGTRSTHLISAVVDKLRFDGVGGMVAGES